MSCETGKVELTYLKKESGLWENYGRLRQRSKNLEIVNSPTKFNFVYKNRVQVTHNIFLLELERTDDAKIIIPIGKHIRVFVKIDGELMTYFFFICLHSLPSIKNFLKRFHTLKSVIQIFDSIY